MNVAAILFLFLFILLQLFTRNKGRHDEVKSDGRLVIMRSSGSGDPYIQNQRNNSDWLMSKANAHEIEVNDGWDIQPRVQPSLAPKSSEDGSNVQPGAQPSWAPTSSEDGSNV